MNLDGWFLRLVSAFHGNGIVLYVLLTTVTAGVLSFFIGLERQLRGEAAGVRTHALIAVSSSLLMTVSIWAIRIADGSLDILSGEIVDNINYDTSRIAAAAVTGIGFLGGGVIIKEKFSVRGLCTASTLWICTAIGLACGAGFLVEAMISTAVVLISLLILGRMLDLIDDKSPSVTVRAKSGAPIVEQIRSISDANGLPLKKIKVTRCDASETAVQVSYIFTTDTMMLTYLCRQLSDSEQVLSAVIKSDGRRTKRKG